MGLEGGVINQITFNCVPQIISEKEKNMLIKYIDSIQLVLLFHSTFPIKFRNIHIVQLKCSKMRENIFFYKMRDQIFQTILWHQYFSLRYVFFQTEISKKIALFLWTFEIGFTLIHILIFLSTDNKNETFEMFKIIGGSLFFRVTFSKCCTNPTSRLPHFVDLTYICLWISTQCFI